MHTTSWSIFFSSILSFSRCFICFCANFSFNFALFAFKGVYFTSTSFLFSFSISGFFSSTLSLILRSNSIIFTLFFSILKSLFILLSLSSGFYKQTLYTESKYYLRYLFSPIITLSIITKLTIFS
jgi:hypothetical protein